MAYSEEQKAEILNGMFEKMAAGSSVRELCKLDPKLPHRTTLYRWIADNEEWQKSYETARQMLCDYWADEILELADDSSNDIIEGAKGPTGNVAAVQRSRLQVDSRKWLMSKLYPKKYGERITQEISGPDGLPINHRPVDGPPQETYEQWLARQKKNGMHLNGHGKSSMDTATGPTS